MLKEGEEGEEERASHHLHFSLLVSSVSLSPRMTATPPIRPLNSLLSSTGSLHPNTSSTSLITPLISLLADPNPHSIDSHLLDLLLNETIRILISSTLYARKKKDQELNEINEDLKRLGINDDNLSKPPQLTLEQETQQVDEIVRGKLESIGYKLGWSLSEKYKTSLPFPFPPLPNLTSSSCVQTLKR